MKPSDKLRQRAFLEMRGFVSDVLRRHDPMKLIILGAPEDEYAPEVDTILPRLKEARTELDLLRVIHEEFVKWFGPDGAGPESSYVACAREIWARWRTLAANISDTED